MERSAHDLSSAMSNVKIRHVFARLQAYKHKRRAPAFLVLYAALRRCVPAEDIYIYVEYIG